MKENLRTFPSRRYRALALSSPACTAAVFLLMAAYLLQGKYLGGNLDPRVMLVGACLLGVQCVIAMLLRISKLVEPVVRPLPAKMRLHGLAFGGDCSAAMATLFARDLSPLPRCNDDGTVCFSKNIRIALALEVLAYGGLLIAISCGTLNFGLGVRGFIMAAPSTAWVDLNSNITVVQQGFMADRSALARKLKVTELRNGVNGGKAQITFELIGGNGPAAVRTLLTGDGVDLDKFRLQFLGDAYMVFSYVTRKDLDFQSEPVYLYRQVKEGHLQYAGALKLNQPGASGIISYDPATARFSVELKEGGRVRLTRRLMQGEVAHQGDYAVQVTGLGHFGRIDIMRHSYRNQIFAGLIIMVCAALARLLCRPVVVWIWSEGSETFFLTRNRTLNRLMRDRQ